jgi:hypothetical protein
MAGLAVVLGAPAARASVGRYGTGQALLGGLHVRDLIHRMVGLAARPREAIRPSAQSLPELQTCGQTGLDAATRRRLVQAVPAQIAELLLRGSRHCRSGDHVSALLCYQELVALDPDNEDYRSLLAQAHGAMVAGEVEA